MHQTGGKNTMKRIAFLSVAVLVLALLLAPALGGTVLAHPGHADVAVSAEDFQFTPQDLTISVGDTVVWTNTGQMLHTVTASDSSWDSGNLDPGKTFSRTFDTAGTFTYYCRFHGSPQGTGMAGTITVQEVGAQAQATTQATAGGTPQATATEAASPTPMIEVSDQPAGDSVRIARVVAAQDGWMVIHTNTADNKPGPVIGHAAVRAGETTDLVVSLDQPVNVGDKLWPMLHIDAGQIGIYEFPGPDAPVIVNGDIVMKQITLTEAAGAAATATPGGEQAQLPGTGGGTGTPGWLIGLLLGGAVVVISAGAFALNRAGARIR
jgi:plastocyanin